MCFTTDFKTQNLCVLYKKYFRFFYIKIFKVLKFLKKIKAIYLEKKRTALFFTNYKFRNVKTVTNERKFILNRLT